MSARDRIFAKLQAAQRPPMPEPDTAGYFAEAGARWESPLARLRHWAKTMTAFKSEIIWVERDNWAGALASVVENKGIKNLLLPTTEAGQTAATHLQSNKPEVKCTRYDRKLEEWKDELFTDIDAGFTQVAAGIAKTGTLVLVPTPQEPRTMSLVPPIHIALFDTATMYDDFFSAMQGLQLASNMPTNVVLVSSPSKTSDIQLTLAFGAHGPRELVILAQLPPGVSMADVQETAQ